MKFNEAQKTALSHKTGPMMVLAGPGSGKTTVITHRIAGLLESGVRPSEILVITFTKASAREMEERFYSLRPAVRDNDTESGRVTFGTFHSVFYRILKLAYRFPAGCVLGEEEKRQYFREFLENSELEVEDEGEFISAVINEISYVKGSQMRNFPAIIPRTVRRNGSNGCTPAMRICCGPGESWISTICWSCAMSCFPRERTFFPPGRGNSGIF